MPGFFDQYEGPIHNSNSAYTGTIATGNSILFRVPTGTTLLESVLRFTVSGTAATTTEMKAQISKVRVVVDGEVKFEGSATQAIALANFYTNDRGCPASGYGIIPLYWHRPWMQDLANQDAPAYGTKGIDSFTIEVFFTGTVTITTASLAHMTMAGEELGSHVVTSVLTRSRASTGIEEIVELPKNPLYALLALHIQTTVSNLSNTGTNDNAIELMVDNARVMYADTVSNAHQRLLTAYSPRAIQTGFVHLDFNGRNRNIDSLPLVMNDLRLKLNWTTAPNSYSIIMETARIEPAKGVAV